MDSFFLLLFEPTTMSIFRGQKLGTYIKMDSP
jgi:hypothetical protein